MRSIWKGAISFGLVTIPVKLYSATEEKDVSFHQVRRSDGSRVRYKRVAAADGEEVSYGDIAKGFDLPTGETVVLTDEDLANLPLTTSRTVDVLQFVPLEQVDPIYFARSYYLEPDKAGAKPYVLLRDALEQSGRVAVVKIALRQREQLATLRVRDGVFVLETMLWPDEVRRPDFPFLDEDVDVRPQELQMASSLIETLSGDFDPSQYTDAYREALQAVIDAKVAGREVVTPSEPETGGAAVLDLMAALRASVDAARAGRDGGAAGREAAAEDQETSGDTDRDTDGNTERDTDRDTRDAGASGGRSGRSKTSTARRSTAGGRGTGRGRSGDRPAGQDAEADAGSPPEEGADEAPAPVRRRSAAGRAAGKASGSTSRSGRTASGSGSKAGASKAGASKAGASKAGVPRTTSGSSAGEAAQDGEPAARPRRSRRTA